MKNSPQYGVAVVIGGSMAGMLAARVLADFFRKVVVIERDLLPDFDEARSTPRKGVPQGYQPHLLLIRGKEVLEELFPGFSSEMEGLGVESRDVGSSLAWYQEGAFFRRDPAGFSMLLASRLAIEAVVRRRVSGLANIELAGQTAVQGLLRDPSGTQITGVKIERRSQTGGGDDAILADLVVDASGRGSRTPSWLEDMGFPRPEEERVEIKVTYASRFYERFPDDLGGDAGILIAPDARRRSFGLLLAQEGSGKAASRWQLTLGGYFGEAPGDTDAEFIEYARNLPDPGIYNLIKDRPALTPVRYHKFPASQRLHYQRLERFPARLLVIGDAIASFNPAYGQGMTIAALEALALRECIQGGLDGIASSYFTKAALLVETGWATAVGADLNFPDTVGKRTAMTRFASWYMHHLVLAARHDNQVRTAFLRVTNLLAPPQSLLAPALAARVLQVRLSRR